MAKFHAAVLEVLCLQTVRINIFNTNVYRQNYTFKMADISRME